MPKLQELTCANCGAAIDVRTLRGMVAACDYCGTSFRVPTSMTPEPAMGDLLLGADFRDPDVPGWVLTKPENLEFRPGSPAEVWASYPASDLIHPIVRTPGPFDDFDVSVTLRFISGTYNYLSAGLELRSWDAGDYVVRLSAQGTFSVGWHQKSDWGGDLLAWASHPALRADWGEANRLRVVMRGEKIRLYFNGVLAAALHDDHFASGRIRVVLSPGMMGPAVVAFANLQVRDLPRE